MLEAKAAAVDRRLTLREILEKVFGLIPRFKSKDELLEAEFSKFVTDLATNPLFNMIDFRAVPQPYRALGPECVNDYVSLNQFAA